MLTYRHHAASSGALDQLLTYVMHSLVWHEAGRLLARLGFAPGLALTAVVAGFWLYRSGVRRRSRNYI